MTMPELELPRSPIPPNSEIIAALVALASQLSRMPMQPMGVTSITNEDVVTELAALRHTQGAVEWAIHFAVNAHLLKHVQVTRTQTKVINSYTVGTRPEIVTKPGIETTPAFFEAWHKAALPTVVEDALDEASRRASSKTDAENADIVIALSGGGVRATLFNLGIFLYLEESQQLRNVTGIVSVSGGSILSAHLMNNWNRLIESQVNFDAEIVELLRFIRTDIRNSVFTRWLWSRLLVVSWFFPWFSRTAILQRRYDLLLKKTTFQDLAKGHRPNIAIVASESLDGARFGFTKQKLVKVPLSADRSSRSIDGEGIHVSLAVAASSCFPPVFKPMRVRAKNLGARYPDFKHEFGATITLNDGGVTGNLGIEVLLWLLQETWRVPSLILVGDAEQTADEPPWYAKCVPLMSEAGARGAALSESERESLRRVHAKRSRFVRLATRNNNAHSLNSRLQALIASFRTDLDSPAHAEVVALIKHGFAATFSEAQFINNWSDTTIRNPDALQLRILGWLNEAGYSKSTANSSFELKEDDLLKCSRRRIWGIAVQAVLVGSILVGVFGGIGYSIWHQRIPVMSTDVTPISDSAKNEELLKLVDDAVKTHLTKHPESLQMFADAGSKVGVVEEEPEVKKEAANDTFGLRRRTIYLLAHAQSSNPRNSDPEFFRNAVAVVKVFNDATEKATRVLPQQITEANRDETFQAVMPHLLGVFAPMDPDGKSLFPS